MGGEARAALVQALGRGALPAADTAGVLEVLHPEERDEAVQGMLLGPAASALSLLRTSQAVAVLGSLSAARGAAAAAEVPTTLFAESYRSQALVHAGGRWRTLCTLVAVAYWCTDNCALDVGFMGDASFSLKRNDTV